MKMDIKPYTMSEIKTKVKDAVDILLDKDAFLLEHGVHERSVTHKLAEYLQQMFPDYHVDCEYNKHGITTKLLPRECEEASERKVFPDIVVHIRGDDSKNLLVIEAKPTPQIDKSDKCKLKLFTATNGKYAYKYGLFIGFDKTNMPKMEWFDNSRFCLSQ